MTRRPTEQLTPLEKTLIDLPQEQAPGDLQDRCLAALDAVKEPTIGRPGQARGPVLLNQLAVATAASLLLAVVAWTVINPPGHRDYRPARDVLYDATNAQGPAGPGGPGAVMPTTAPPVPNYASRKSPQQILAENNTSWQDRTFSKQRKVAAEQAPGAPGGRVLAMEARAINQARGSYFGHKSAAPAAPAAPGGPAAEVGYNDKAPAEREDELAQNRLQSAAQSRVAAAPPAVPPVDAARPNRVDVDSVVPSPPEPWYDRSPDRQKITARDMEIETPNVEETYHKVVDAIEKAGGYIATENLIVQEDEPDKATLAARVPTDSFDAVLQQLRGLGKLVKLTGTSEDRTLEYKSRGSDIRGLSVAEQKLVERYERETNPHRKAAIKLELDSLRRTLHSEKQALQALAAETAFGYLNMEITEGSHFWQTVKDKAGDTLPIAMALALVALPFFVVALIWRRRA